MFEKLDQIMEVLEPPLKIIFGAGGIYLLAMLLYTLT